MGGKTYYQFRVVFNDPSIAVPRILKTYQEFQHLEAIVREQAARLSQFFHDAAPSAGGRMNDPSPAGDDAARTTVPIPFLAPARAALDARVTNTVQSFASSVTSTASADEPLHATVKLIETFSNEVLANKLLWTPEILLFFQVPHDLLIEYEHERDAARTSRIQQLTAGSRGNARSECRSRSYVDLDQIRASMKEIWETEPDAMVPPAGDDPGSCDQ